MFKEKFEVNATTIKKFCETLTDYQANTEEINIKEIWQLHIKLTKYGVPHEFDSHWTKTGYQICYPNSKDRICSAVCFNGSYGCKEGLIEIMGLLTEEESKYDDVIGYLTAEDVFNRIWHHYANQ